MKIGGYTLDLYCDADKCIGHNLLNIPEQFYGQSGPECVRQARRKGWRIGKLAQLCPWCSGKNIKVH